MTREKRQPIQYEDLVDIRFADLDFYSHVNSKHYVDLVSTARINYMTNVMKISMEEVAKRGLGFFLTRSTINYKRPIAGLQKVFVRSHVEELRGGKILVIPFEILSENKEKLYSDGTLEFSLIDMQTLKSTQAPDWIFPYFYKS